LGFNELWHEALHRTEENRWNYSQAEVDTWIAEWKKIYPTSSWLADWLEDELRPPRLHLIRRERDDDRRTIWTVPDFENGRSRTLAIDRTVLRVYNWKEIVAVLERNGWRETVNRHDRLVTSEDGKLAAVTWKAEPSENGSGPTKTENGS
jgi:hypothetical protein